MPIATLSSLKKKEEASGGGGGGGGGSDNSYYNGGAGRQGGSSTNQFAPPDPNDPFAQIVNQARGGAAGGGGGGSSRGEGEAGREGAKQLKLTMYKDGFSVGDDGDFRPISDPKNKKLLDALHQGFLPNELREAHGIAPGEHVDVGLVDARSMTHAEAEEAKAQASAGSSFMQGRSTKPAVIAFSGHGQTLGASAGGAAAGAAAAASAGGGGSQGDGTIFVRGEFEGSATTSSKGDGSTTTLQVVLPGGKRFRQSFPRAAPLADVALFAEASGLSASTFSMAAGFPPKALKRSDAKKTLEELGLLQARVIFKEA